VEHLSKEAGQMIIETGMAKISGLTDQVTKVDGKTIKEVVKE